MSTNPTFNGYELRPLPDGRSRKARDRFWPRVDKTPGQGPQGECWVWQGSRKKVNINGRDYDYGQVGMKHFGKFHPLGAHVVSFYLTRGRFPKKGMMVCHTCDNPPCVNPAHLWEGTAKDNGDDARAKGRMPVAPPPLPRYLRIRFRPTQLIKIHKARAKKKLNIYDVALALGINYTLYYKFEAGERPSLTVAQFDKLRETLGLEVLKVSESQYYEHGVVGRRCGKKGEPKPYLKAYSDKPHAIWSKLPLPTIDLYRADLLRAAMIRAGVRFVKTYQALGLSRNKFIQIVNGECGDFNAVSRVSRHLGLPESQVFNTQEAKAA